jgi:hypothetical protein
MEVDEIKSLRENYHSLAEQSESFKTYFIERTRLDLHLKECEACTSHGICAMGSLIKVTVATLSQQCNRALGVTNE